MTDPITQIGGSLDDYISRVRHAFEQAFNKGKQPDAWLWVRDVFEHHVIARDGDQHWQIGMKVGADAITFDARASWKKVSLDYVAQMADGEHRGPVHEIVVTEFRGRFPEVAVPDEVSSALAEIDDQPFFMTLEVSRTGRVSRSGLEHDDALGESIAEQINAGAKTGIMGHLREEERGSAYPVPDIYWVGATRKTGSTWAKGYVPKSKPEVREHYRVLMATNGKAATSIYGAAVKQMVDPQKGTYRLKAFKLEQLDLAPQERAALPLDGKWTITAQMSEQESEESTMTKEELIAQLTATDIPATVREQIIREWQASQGQQDRVAQMEQQLVAANAALDQFRVQEFNTGLDAKIAELVVFEATTDEAKARLAALRSSARRAVLAELAGERSLEKATAALTAYVGTDEYKALAGAVVAELAGPAAIVGAATRQDPRKLNDTPEARAKARSQFNFQT
jgi:hypothetical protein